MTMDEDTVQNLYRANKVQQKRIKELEAEVIKHRQGRLDSLELISEYDQKWGAERISLNQRIKELEAENKRLKGTCMCMDCGKIIKTVDQSKHNKECEKKSKP